MDNRSIGIFDSGIGGITVLKEYLKILPHENYIYFADTKHLPYGDKTKEQIISYAEEIVEYFIQKDVKAVIIACGTASSLAYEHLKAKYSIPIFDIITPVARQLSNQKVGLIATQGSINSHVWEKTIHSYYPTIEVYSKACPKLVPLAEKSLANSLRAKLTLKHYLKGLKQNSIESLILGCTHYPLFSPLIQKEVGEKVTLINIGTASALNFQQYLLDNSLENSSDEKGTISYFVNGNEQEFFHKIKALL